MGAHWAWLGYNSVDALVAEARRSVAGQTALMARYIEKAGLTAALRRGDWTAFARGYNGPDYKRHGYDRKIAMAYARYRRTAAGSGSPPAAGILARGASGSEVVDLQTLLVAAGHAVVRDGVYGLATEQAVMRFQAARGLAADGVAGPLTMAALSDALSARGWWRRLAAWCGRVWD